jgi:hypothetical protein
MTGKASQPDIEHIDQGTFTSPGRRMPRSAACITNMFESELRHIQVRKERPAEFEVTEPRKLSSRTTKQA